MNPVAAISLAVSAPVVTGIVSHAFHSWLKQRERERFSSLDREQLTKRIDELRADHDKRWLEVKQFIGNNRR